FLIPEGAFMRVMAVATAAAVVTWMVIVLVHLKFRHAHENEKLRFPAPGCPWANYLCVAFLLLILGVMTKIESMRAAVYILPAWLLVLCIGYRLRQLVQRRQERSAAS